MSKYFKDVNTLEELRRQYRDLLKKYHPDNANGNTQATQEINAEFVSNAKIPYKPQSRTTLDKEKLTEVLGEDLKPFEKTTSYNVLRVSICGSTVSVKPKQML